MGAETAPSPRWGGGAAAARSWMVEGSQGMSVAGRGGSPDRPLLSVGNSASSEWPPGIEFSHADGREAADPGQAPGSKSAVPWAGAAATAPRQDRHRSPHIAIVNHGDPALGIDQHLDQVHPAPSGRSSPARAEAPGEPGRALEAPLQRPSVEAPAGALERVEGVGTFDPAGLHLDRHGCTRGIEGPEVDLAPRRPDPAPEDAPAGPDQVPLDQPLAERPELRRVEPAGPVHQPPGEEPTGSEGGPRRADRAGARPAGAARGRLEPQRAPWGSSREGPEDQPAESAVTASASLSLSLGLASWPTMLWMAARLYLARTPSATCSTTTSS